MVIINKQTNAPQKLPKKWKTAEIEKNSVRAALSTRLSGKAPVSPGWS